MSISAQLAHTDLPTHQPDESPLPTISMTTQRTMTIQRTLDEEFPHVAILQIPDSINRAGADGLLDHARALRVQGQHTLLLDLRPVSDLNATGLLALEAIAALYEWEPAAAGDAMPTRKNWLARKSSPPKQPPSKQPPQIKLFGTRPHIRARLEQAALPVYDSLVTALMAV